MRLVRVLRPWWRILLRGVLFVLPTLLLLPFGMLWLHERGWLRWWFLGVSIATVVALLAARLGRPELPPFHLREPGIGASPGEQEARARLKRLADSVTSVDVMSFEAVAALAQRVVREVSAAFHPDVEDSRLRVTLPELLLVIERTSRFGRARVLQHFGWLRDIPVDLPLAVRDGLPSLQKLSTAWRIIRFARSPINGLIQEVQSLALGRATRGLQQAGVRRLGQLLVEELGEAAILLYSGQCRLAAGEMTEALRSELMPEQGLLTKNDPIRVVLVGSPNAGKSSLFNALLGKTVSLAGHHVATRSELPHRLDHSVSGRLVLVDLPGIPATGEPDAGILMRADLILWVVPLHRADRTRDALLLQAFGRALRADPRRTPPPVLFVGTHADRLDPVREWSPPYDIENPTRVKETTIAKAVVSLRGALPWPKGQWIPTVVGPDLKPWNVEAVHQAIADARLVAEVVRVQRLQFERTMRQQLREIGNTARFVGRETIKAVQQQPVELARSGLSGRFRDFLRKRAARIEGED